MKSIPLGPALAAFALAAIALAVPTTPSTAQPLPGAAAGEMGNSWRSSTRSRFHHVLEAEPGRHRLTITASTSSPGGETVAVYPQTAGGERGSPRIGFVIATRAGDSEEMFVTIPAPAEGEILGRLPIVVDVENASGREYSGEYSLTLAPARGQSVRSGGELQSLDFPHKSEATPLGHVAATSRIRGIVPVA